MEKREFEKKKDFDLSGILLIAIILFLFWNVYQEYQILKIMGVLYPEETQNSNDETGYPTKIDVIYLFNIAACEKRLDIFWSPTCESSIAQRPVLLKVLENYSFPYYIHCLPMHSEDFELCEEQVTRGYYYDLVYPETFENMTNLRGFLVTPSLISNCKFMRPTSFASVNQTAEEKDLNRFIQKYVLTQYNTTT